MNENQAEPRPRQHRSREIPWLPVVRFHKEIVTRAEEGFFSLNGRDDQSERWSSIPSFEPANLAGPWKLDTQGIQSRPFRLALEQGQVESLFIGGPCYLGWTKLQNGDFLAQWRPLLYREVSFRNLGDELELTPQQGKWNLSPLVSAQISRSELDLGCPLDELGPYLIETAVRHGAGTNKPMDSLIREVLSMKFPALASELLGKSARPDTFRVQPSPWVVFAPTQSFSALTRYLLKDYERLEGLLAKDAGAIGGLKLLEDLPDPGTREASELLPLIPLNRVQREAVQRILDQKPLTVISGPPGTGKSQIVVSLLLNAWAQGKSVLFASNNNKAVDVVRERVERFESEFPIAVRAGAKQKQNIQEVLRRTLNMAGTGGPDGIAVSATAMHRQSLAQERQDLLTNLDGQTPQRIDESRKTALSAYGSYRDKLAQMEEKDKALLQEQASLGYREWSADNVTRALDQSREWLDAMGHHRGLAEADEQRRTALQAQLQEQERSRNREVERVGLFASQVADWQWLITGPSPELATDWEQRFRALITGPLDQSLEEIIWDPAFDTWASDKEALHWGDSARSFRESILQACADLAPKLQAIKTLDETLQKERARMAQMGLPEGTELPLVVLTEWSTRYAEWVTLGQGRLDFLPWSKRARVERSLRGCFHRMRSALPLELLRDLGNLTGAGHHRLVPLVGVLRRWLELRGEMARTKPIQDEVETRLGGLRQQCVLLKVSAPPPGLELEAWFHLADQLEQASTTSDHAAQAWRRRAEKDATEKTLRQISQEWLRFGGGIPIREAWRKGRGKAFETALKQLGEHPSLESLAQGRRELYAGQLNELIEVWKAACGFQESMQKLTSRVHEIPGHGGRIKAWYAKRPDKALVLDKTSRKDWPDLAQPTALLDKVADWSGRWKDFHTVERVVLKKKAAEELKWALSKLEQAIALLPETKGKPAVITAFQGITRKPESEWPVQELNTAFAEFSPEKMKGRIERIEAELERTAFADAKAQWLGRLRADVPAIQAVDTLEKSIRMNRGEVLPADYQTFSTALRLVPIWITTAQAAQAIPLLPEIFDIVVIDEASQCTLTNLLPLVYRGKSLAVIGDDQQLPSIPTIRDAEEMVLAKKYDIEAFLPIIGHASNDVYKTATESLPRRRADVIMLEEHFRSHPQIIGFSNRHIYQQRLELKKDPQWGVRLPIGSGVHSIHVNGLAQRGAKNKSWLNEPEGRRVLEVLARLKQGDARCLSVGIVTPFSAQKEWLRNEIDALGLTSEVLVDTANGFQGDERDVIIFSPVVAKGIQEHSARWVESPPNLINVAITRARDILFVVADLEYCMRQDGILRKLALYCKDIQLLRKTSPAELELYSWMLVKGWSPKIHQPVGDLEVDFILDGSKGNRIAIEVDGQEHHEGTLEQDKARDAFLLGRGYDVLRIQAREVFETPFEVLHRIGVLA